MVSASSSLKGRTMEFIPHFRLEHSLRPRKFSTRKHEDQNSLDTATTIA